ncbi:MAG: L,D-transpeptidase family protein [Candidatus Dormibacteraceae bacterium]
MAALVAGLGLGNQYAFNRRENVLRASWQQERAAGVSRADLAPLRQQLTSLQQQRKGPLPYPYYSMALYTNPFSVLASRTGRVYQAALRKARKEAKANLAALQADYGPTPFDLATYQKQLAQARTPGQYLTLEKSWTVEAAQVTANRTALSSAAGGLTAGLPASIVNGKAQLEQQAQTLAQAKLWTTPEPAADTAAATYLKGSYATMLQQYGAIAQQLSSDNQTLTARVQMHTQAQNLVAALPALIQSYSQGSNDQSQFQQDQQALGAATDDTQMTAAVTSLQSLYNPLYQAKLAAEEAAANPNPASGACIPGAPAQLIIVHTASQEMVAYNNGCPFLSTPVTTGMPALRTDTGTFHIFAKYVQFTMVSEWPPSSPYWYPTTVVPDAMEFVSDGTFIHGAPWEPSDAFGADSDNGPYASHGCVHTPPGALGQLYSWAQIGATVTVES